MRVSDVPADYPAPNRLLQTAVGERPQERLERHGAGALSDTELLAMLLRSGTHGQDVLTLREWRRVRQTLREVAEYHAKSRQSPGLRPPGRARLISVRGVRVDSSHDGA